MFGRHRNQPTRETFPAGTYFVGDPCYPFPNEGPHSELWDEVCDILFAGGETRQTQFFDFKGHRLAMDSTAFGDGYYSGSDGNHYGVDAGMLGLVPVALCEFLDPNYVESLKEMGQIVTFDHEFEVEFDNGLFHFGHLIIDTCGADEEEEDEDDYTFTEDDEDEEE